MPKPQTVWWVWHGGASYTPPKIPEDVEKFSSINQARQEFVNRPGNPWFKAVWQKCPEDGGPTAHVFFQDPSILPPDPYPDRVFCFGKNGGFRMEQA